jgi:hypothetical protein
LPRRHYFSAATLPPLMPYFILLRHYDIAIIDITPLFASSTPAARADACFYFRQMPLFAVPALPLRRQL